MIVLLLKAAGRWCNRLISFGSFTETGRCLWDLHVHCRHYLIWSTPRFQTGISCFEIQGVGLFQQTSLSSLSCLPSVTCLRRCLDPIHYSFFVSCMCPEVFILFYSHTFYSSMLNSLVSLPFTKPPIPLFPIRISLPSLHRRHRVLFSFSFYLWWLSSVYFAPLFFLCLSFVFSIMNREQGTH
jgi:hypothetical protein